MAKKQTRRTVSLNRSVYQAALEEAHRRGKSLSELVTEGLHLAGVVLPETEHVELAVVQHAQERRARLKAVKQKLDAAVPGPIRRALGDDIANALGEPLRKVAV